MQSRSALGRCVRTPTDTAIPPISARQMWRMTVPEQVKNIAQRAQNPVIPSKEDIIKII